MQFVKERWAITWLGNHPAESKAKHNAENKTINKIKLKMNKTWACNQPHMLKTTQNTLAIA